jgi:hypothetical protein
MQMSLALAGLIALLTIGLHPVTWILVVGATALTIVSRLLYRGRPGQVERRKSQ